MKVSDVTEALFRAARILETDGHCKFIQRDAEGRYCAIGAAYAAVGAELDFNSSGPMDGPLREKAELVSNMVVDSLGIASSVSAWGKWGALAWWNNAGERTAEEVIAAFRNAAYELQSAYEPDKELVLESSSI